MAMWILTAVYVAALGLLLWVAHKNKAFYAAAKGLCSGLFLLCALLSYFTGMQAQPGAFALLFAALCLCAFGDVLLGVANRTSGKVNKHPFVVGAIGFALAHVLFCLQFYGKAPFTWWDLALPVALWVVLFVLEKTGAVRLKKMRPMAYVYTFLVALMATKAVQAFFAGGAAAGGWKMAVGALLFLVSDVVLLFLYFGTKRHRWLRPVNLISYYAGVYLLALGAGQ